jgi:molecular chaperone HscC
MLRLEVYQGESLRVANNLFLGHLEVAIPRLKKGEATVDVRFTYDVNGILEVEVTSVLTGETTTLVIEKNEEKWSPERLAARLEELKAIKIHPRDQTANRLLLARAERLYEESVGEKRVVIMQYLLEFEGALALQDSRKIARAAKELQDILDSMEQHRDF